MLNTLLPALLFSWVTTVLLFRLLHKVEADWLRFILKLSVFPIAFLIGMVGSFFVFFLTIWAFSGMPLSEFLHAPTGAGQNIISWLGYSFSGALAGALYSQFRKWRSQ